LLPIDYQQEEGLTASLPLGVNKIPISRHMTTSSIAVFMPFTSRELFQINNKTALYYGLNTLTRNMIIADKLLLHNPNTLILGTPGSGKSFAIKRELAEVFFRLLDDIFITDRYVK
jgi:type IV secretory pathway VirB4 component